MKKILNIVGARPNFMKIAPIHQRLLQSKKLKPILLHTGQHYDQKMSKIFFDDLGMTKPEIYLGVGSGTHAEQTGQVMIEIEKVISEIRPDLVLVVGDVNSTLAASLVASKLHIKIGHVEAGLRSFDRKMPEEINRIVTDSLADYLFITEESGRINLLNEGISENKIHFVGNVMIDSLMHHQKRFKTSTILDTLNLNHSDYALLTLHRPSNVDDSLSLKKLLSAFEQIERKIKIIFPIHPRTVKMLDQFGLLENINKMTNIILIDPVGYIDFMNLMQNAKFLLTDSGGIQEETTVLGVPCLTLRENTERPVTIKIGTNKLVGWDTDKIVNESFKILSGDFKEGNIPPLWDGNTAKRIVTILENQL